MITVKLEEIAEVFRGYAPKSDFVTKDKEIGRPVFLINYSDISNGSIKHKEYTLLKNVNFDKLYQKYQVTPQDIILPTTFSSNLEIKYNTELITKDLERSKIMPLYAQNVIVIRLKEQANFKYEPDVFWHYLSLERVQEKLIEKAYSNGKTTKAVMIEKLRELKVPLPAEKLFPIIKEYSREIQELKKLRNKMEKTEEQFYNIIEKDILS